MGAGGETVSDGAISDEKQLLVASQQTAAGAKAGAARRWSLASLALDALERAAHGLAVLTSPRLGRSRLLLGNYGPVPELPRAAGVGLPVVGELPECLNGEFVRNGPNSRFEPKGQYHFFDGDGMLHGVRIKDGKATYVNRFVRTSRLQQEEEYGEPKFLKIGDLRGKLGLLHLVISAMRAKLGLIDLSKGAGTANTSVVFHAGRLMALHEGDVPYEMRVLADGELETVGTYSYGGRLDHSFTAHPKVDAETGEMMLFGNNFRAKPHVTYRVVTKEGSMGQPVAINIPDPIMMHDFAITKHYSIFMDLPLLFSPQEMVKGGLAFKFDRSREARFGILPRHAKSDHEIKWFTVPTCFIFHTANAWEEGDEVVLLACRMPYINMDRFAIKEKQPCLDTEDVLFEFRFNLATGTTSQVQVADVDCDFPTIHPNRLGMRSQFAYIACERQTGYTGFRSVQKVDLWQHKIVGKFIYGHEQYGGEAIFVPKNKDINLGDEDDGYLLTFVYDTQTDKSEMLVIDAKTMQSEPVGSVPLPQRIPYGFHGIFVPEEQLQEQLSSKMM